MHITAPLSLTFSVLLLVLTVGCGTQATARNDAALWDAVRSGTAFAMMRHAAVYDNQEDRDEAIRAIQTVLGQFENLFRNMGDVNNGFAKKIPLYELQGKNDVLKLDIPY